MLWASFLSRISLHILLSHRPLQGVGKGWGEGDCRISCTTEVTLEANEQYCIHIKIH